MSQSSSAEFFVSRLRELFLRQNFIVLYNVKWVILKTGKGSSARPLCPIIATCCSEVHGAPWEQGWLLASCSSEVSAGGGLWLEQLSTTCSDLTAPGAQTLGSKAWNRCCEYKSLSEHCFRPGHLCRAAPVGLCSWDLSPAEELPSSGHCKMGWRQ